jgi:tripartite-type tricarboxylate transporter receptor subunit TctC
MMKFPRRRLLHLAAGAAALPAVSRFVWVQAYPTKPITMLVPFAAGGGTDLVGRIMVERKRESLGQPVIIENVTGANGTVAAGRAARAAPDGYALIAGTSGTHVFNGALYALRYDVANDFAPPKGTPVPVVAKLNAAAVGALAPSDGARLAELGQEIPPREQQTPEALRALQKAKIEKWWPIIKAANIKGE